MNYFFEHYTGADYYLLYKYILGCYIITGALILRTVENKPAVFLRQDRNLLISFVVFLVFFAGTRGFKIGTDTSNYFNFYFKPGSRIENMSDFFSYFHTDFMFEVLMYLIFPFKNFTLFLLTIAIITNYNLYNFSRKFTNYGKKGSSLLLFLTIASAFSFMQIELNIMRNALSISFIYMALYYVVNKERNKSLIFFVIALMFHSTALIPIAAIITCSLSTKISLKYFIVFYILAIGLAFIGFGFNSIPLLQDINSDDFKRLASAETFNYRVGFRPDFVLYNSFFLFLFVKFSDLKNNTDLFLIKYFIITSAIFYFNFHVAFSDRIGLYSWIVIPVLLFNTINNSFPNKKLYIASIAALGYFVLNYLILFPS